MFNMTTYLEESIWAKGAGGKQNTELLLVKDIVIKANQTSD